jgi:outer membrane protein TolC
LPFRIAPPGLILAFSLCAAAAFGQTPPASTGSPAPGGSPAPAESPAPRRITPDEAVELAIQNNLGLESDRITLDTKKRASTHSWNQFIPDLSVSGTLARSNEASTGSMQFPIDISDFLSPPLPAGSVYGTSASFPYDMPQWNLLGNFSVSLNFNITMIENIKKARLDYQGGLLTYANAQAKMEQEVRNGYYDILLAQEQLALQREGYAAAERQVAMAQANYNSGLAPQLTLLQAQVSRDSMKPEIEGLENRLKMAMDNFAMTLGLDYGTQFELVPVEGEPTYLDLDLADLISKAANGNPSVMELRQSILSLQSQRKATALRARTPTLALSWAYSPTFTRDPWKDSWFDGDFWMDNGRFSVSLAMSLNSFLPFTTTGQGIKDLDNALRSLNIGLAQAVRGTELQIYNAVSTLEQTRNSMDSLDQTVALADRSYQLTEQAYRAGLQSLMEVQNAEQSRRQARFQKIAQQLSYRKGLIDLEYSIGVPFGTLSNGGNSN